ncbi:MAG: VOC family protein, partial [Methanomassiliicoccales archaeon]|nr:VOC family protein [Methanomassiliicoccales archaeon]
MRSINPYLNFNGTTEEAFNFYRSVFGGEFSTKMRYRDMPDGDKLPESEQDRILHMALPLKSGTLYGSDTLESRGPKITNGNSVYIMISPESEDEARKMYDALSAGGEIEMALDKTFWG